MKYYLINLKTGSLWIYDQYITVQDRISKIGRTEFELHFKLIKGYDCTVTFEQVKINVLIY
jgi:hypothetical protein